MVEVVVRHDGFDAEEFGDGAAEGNHDGDVIEAHFFADFFYGLAFEGEGGAIVVAIVAGGAAPADHRVLLDGLEVFAPE